MPVNLQQPNHDRDNPNQQPLEKKSKTHDKKIKVKMKNDTGKWCDFQKIPCHNIDECRLIQSLVAEFKDTKLNAGLESDP